MIYCRRPVLLDARPLGRLAYALEIVPGMPVFPGRPMMRFSPALRLVWLLVPLALVLGCGESEPESERPKKGKKAEPLPEGSLPELKITIEGLDGGISAK